MKRILFIFFLLITFTAQAGYFVVDRNCNLKETPQSNGRLILRLVPDDVLDQLELADHNGYYRVRLHGTTTEGWVYYTYLLQYDDDLEEDVADAAEGLLQVRIVDVGQGQCNLITLPNGKYIVFDAGDYTGVSKTMERIDEVIDGNNIELMILSHTDADHLGAARGIIEQYNVKHLLWGNFIPEGEDPSNTYKNLATAIRNSDIDVVDLNELDSTIKSGSKVKYGDVTLTYLCGFGKPPAEWDEDNLDESEQQNAVSIVIKLQYGDNSIMFCGDAVGRHRNDPDNALRATEKYLIKNAKTHLKSNIVVAPHHGASNGSSKAFVEQTKPEYVVFCAGNRRYSHPTSLTAKRYLKYTSAGKLFRTDRGDDEGALEWDYQRIDGCKDKAGDDDIQIDMPKTGKCKVRYLNNSNVCEQ